MVVTATCPCASPSVFCNFLLLKRSSLLEYLSDNVEHWAQERKPACKDIQKGIRYYLD
jgi:hypothetical protein